MHILAGILISIGALALFFGCFVIFAGGGAEEDVSGGPAFIGCAAAVMGALLVCLGGLLVLA